MKVLIIYYSFEGNTKFIANKIQERIGGDLLELVPIKQSKSKGFSKYIWGGRQVMMNAKPAIESYNINLNMYDYVFIGTPVWAGTFVPALNTFFTNENIVNKKLLFFVCHEGGMGKVFKKLANRLSENEIVSQIDFKSPLKDDETKIDLKLNNWIDENFK